MVNMKEQIITSKSNSLIKEFAKLKNKKYRLKSNLVILEGKRIISDAISRGINLKALFILDDVKDKYLPLFKDVECNLFITSKPAYENLSDTVNSQGVIAIAEISNNSFDIPKTNFLVLDNISDPGNMGTIIRTAVACGFNYIYTFNCVDVFNEKVLRSTMGTIFDAKIINVDLSQISVLAESFEVFAADMNGKDVFTHKIQSPIFGIVMGNEGNGLTTQIKNLCKKIVSLPMQNGVESLNVSVACAVLMYVLKNNQN